MKKNLQTPFHSRNIILVDDDSDDRELFAEAVAFVNPSVNLSIKKDGEELMEHLLNKKPLPDLIFLDLNMPRKNGKECLVEIRKNNFLRHIPVIIYTTSLNPVDIEETFKEGAHYFFRKPNSFEELKAILHKLFESDINNTLRQKEEFVLNGKLKMEYK